MFTRWREWKKFYSYSKHVHMCLTSLKNKAVIVRAPQCSRQFRKHDEHIKTSGILPMCFIFGIIIFGLYSYSNFLVIRLLTASTSNCYKEGNPNINTCYKISFIKITHWLLACFWARHFNLQKTVQNSICQPYLSRSSVTQAYKPVGNHLVTTCHEAKLCCLLLVGKCLLEFAGGR